ncbi:MAG: SCP2 sterol-binding domain-containing protein [Alphaproteobacteria bacterium]
MTSTATIMPPLSPALLAGVALRPLPLPVLRPALRLAMAAVVRRHPRVFEPLSGFDSPTYVIDPVDLPLVFILRPTASPPSLDAERTDEGLVATATVRGPLSVLLDLLEGRIDGDAMFFSRELVISGDTEAVLALRNAVDGAGIDFIADLLSFLGPLRGPAGRVVERLGGLARRFEADLDMLREAVIAPSLKRVDAEAARIRSLEERIATMERQKTKVGTP